jgi:hypothetical protein
VTMRPGHFAHPGIAPAHMGERGRDRIRPRVADAPRALSTLSLRFISLDRVGGAGEHQERATGGMRKLLGGASVDQASNRAIAARAYDQQIERRAVQRKLLGRLTVGRVRFDAAPACDSLKGILDEALGRSLSPASCPTKAYDGSDTASSAESLAAHATASVRATECACSLSGDPS